LEAKRPPPADVVGFVSFVSAQSSPIPESAILQGGRALAANHRPAMGPENLERRRLREPTKLTNPTMTPPEGSFVSAQSSPISEFEISKTAASENRQNRQNPLQYRAGPSERLDCVLAVLDSGRPDLVEHDRWRQAVDDGRRFLAAWGAQALALGWSTRDLFGLHQPPETAHPSYRRLSRYDCAGLVWLLQGRPVVAMTEVTAAIQNSSGNVTVYRRLSKPALGPIGDSLDDFK
jgi:hypothetical protein